MMQGGAFGYGALLLGLACAVFVGALAACSLARIRVPLPLWLAPGALLVGFGAFTTLLQVRQAEALLAQVPIESMPEATAAIYTALKSAERLSLIFASLVFAASALSSAVGVVQSKRRVVSYLYGAAPVVYGAIGGVGIALVGLALAGPTLPILGLGALTLLMSVAQGLSTSVRSNSRHELKRIAEIRLVVTTSALLAIWTWTLGWHMETGLAGITEPSQLALTSLLTGSSAFSVLVIGGAGALGIGSVGRYLLTPRTLSGGVVASLTLAVLGVASLGASRSTRDIAYDAFGGALQEEPMLGLPTLPTGVSLGGENRAAPLSATCLTTDGRRGWQAASRYRTFDIQHHLDQAHDANIAISEIDSLPGCPSERAPLADPLSTFEQPAVVIAGDRMAASVTGTEWFLEQGDVQVITITRGVDPRDRPQEVQAVSFRWERPPVDTQPAPPPEGGEPGEWNYPAARVMLRGVLLLEGPVPMVIADGRRAWLKEGQAGEAQLREAMMNGQRRELILVPRKHWTVQDLVRYCLAISDIEESRCVIRPENTTRWTERTGLALPW